MASRIIMPQGGQDITEGLIVRWIKAEGEPVRKGEVICEVETEKAVFEVSSPVDGVLLKIVAPAGTQVPIFSLIGVVGEPGEAFEVQALDAPAPPPAGRPDVAAIRRRLGKDEAAGEGAKISGRAQKLAAEKGVDLKAVIGSGPQGRIVEKDVLLHVDKRRISVSGLRGAAAPLSRMRLAVARSVTRSKQAIPHFYVNAAVDMTAALLERERLKAEGIAEVSVTAWVVKAAALALKAFPAVNSRVEGERLVVFEDVNIGIAVGTDEGLIVPVLPRADTLGLVDLARRSEALIAAARAGRQVSFDPGTFTVSNLGMFGIDSFTAIINPPEAAILAVGAVSRRPAAAAGGGIELRDLMQITLSVDHRIIDGALAARFINHVKHGLENPGTLIGPS